MARCFNFLSMLTQMPRRNKLLWLFCVTLILSTTVLCYLYTTSTGVSVSLQQQHRSVRKGHFHDPTFLASDLVTFPLSASLASSGDGASVHRKNSTNSQIGKNGQLSIALSHEVLSQGMGGRVEVLERSHKYCNIFEHSTFDNKDDFPATYNLSSIIVVFRHGDRSPIFTLPNHRLLEKLSCNLADDKSTQSQTFLKFISLVELRQEKQVHPDTWWQNSYPRSTKCAAGQLTSRGFQQMINLGKTFRRTYIDHKHLWQAFSNLSSKVYLRATEYSRTFQSAVGFLYGFLSNADFKHVKVEFDKDIYFCSQSVGNFSCYCPAAMKLQKTIDHEYQQMDDKDRSMNRQIKEKLATIFGTSTSQIPWLGAVLEVAMTHVCHGLNLPCRENSQKISDCLPWSVLSKLWHYLDNSGQRHQNSTTREKYAQLVSYPLLHEIIQRFLTVVRYNTLQNSTRIHLFSGHDKTVFALLKSLKIYDSNWPPYASNLVFELYDRNKKQFYVRFLYNGKDVTKQVRFCRDIGNATGGLCPFDNFMYFVFYEMSKHFGTSKYEDMCRL